MNKTTNTPAFYYLTWFAFLLASFGTVIGVVRLEADIQTKGFFIMSYLFSVFTAFTLAKVIRDREEDKARNN